MTVAVSLLKNILTPLGITAGATVIDAGIQNKKQKKHGSGTTALSI